MEVRREDQEKINKFSSLHQKETSLEEELRAKIVSAAPWPSSYIAPSNSGLYRCSKTLGAFSAS